MHPYRISTLAFSVTMAVFFLSAASLVLMLGDRLPAPHFSKSMALNEKGLWLRHALKQGRTAEIIVAGSSMAMDNINGAELAKIAGTDAIINTGSWNLTTPQSFKILRILMERLHPKLVIFPVHYGDFEKPELTALDFSLFRKCLYDSSIAPLYFQSLDAYSMQQAYLYRQSQQARNRQIFETLSYDNYGGIPLNPDHFSYNKSTWDGLNDPRLKDIAWDPEAFTAIQEMAVYLHEHHCALLVVACPMRPPVEEKFSAQFERELWSRMPALLGANGQFVHVPGAEFDDSHFADSIHLNARGGTKLTDRLAPNIRELLQPPPEK
jgi:hypothetical protein